MRTAGILLISAASLAGCTSSSRAPAPATGDDPSSVDPGTADPVPADPGPTDPGPTPGPTPGPDATKCAADNGGITLPPGFCATVFADGAGKPRQIAVTPGGVVFVAVEASSPTANDAHVLALLDLNHDGVAELRATFGDAGGNGIAWHDGQLYVAANDRIVRYGMPDGRSSPADARPVVVVGGLPATGDHTAKTVVVSGDDLFINIGSASNSCQVANRELHSPGKDPCDELPTRAGVWQFDARLTDQTLDCGTRIATGMRNTNALALDRRTQTLWGAINGRDQLHENWPELYTEDQDNRLPSDEVVEVKPGVDRGWPYCYHDQMAGHMMLAPEYGGDGVARGRCAAIDNPAVALAAHSAPLAIELAGGTMFPAAYRAGAFVSNHGSRFDANAGSDLHGYDVEFLPFSNGRPTGEVQRFATGFDAGMRPLPDAAPHRPVGLAMMPDGSLLIGDDKGGRIWRVIYTGQ